MNDRVNYYISSSRELIGTHGFLGPAQKEYFRFIMHPAKFIKIIIEHRSGVGGLEIEDNVGHKMTLDAFLRELDHIDLIYYEYERRRDLQA